MKVYIEGMRAFDLIYFSKYTSNSNGKKTGKKS